MNGPLWTPDEIKTAQRLMDDGAKNEQFLAELGRTRHACWNKLQYERSKVPTMQKVNSARPKPEMVADAYRRAAAPRTISGFVFGDPGKGHSALDRREERI